MTNTSTKEIVFQVVLHLVVFIFFSFDRAHPLIEVHEVVFFLVYAAVALLINYILLPRFYYRKKYIPFALYILLVIIAVILVEELILERIFFSDTRANNFPGVLFTLVQILPVITILVGFKFARDALVKQSLVDELQHNIIESELQFLKSQINPHFLFNNLNNLYSYALTGSPKTPEIILELSGVLRYMLYECKEKYVPLKKEIMQLENFVNLNKMQIEGRGEVRFSAPNLESNYQIAPLILVVFIENAFKHSSASQSDDIFIEIDMRLSDQGRLNFSCKNTFQKQSNYDRIETGIGLENVRKRLALLYPDAHELDIRKGDDHYEVKLSIDLTGPE